MWELFGDFNEGELLFLGRWSTALLVTLGVGVGVVLLLSFLDLREMRPRRRGWTLLALRAAVLGCGLLLLMEPALELRAVQKIKNHVVVLVDASRSMTIQTPSGKTREEVVQGLLADFAEAGGERSEQHRFDFFVFSEEAERISLPALVEGDAKAADAEGSRLREALDAVSEAYGRNELAGVVLISDGVDSGVLGGRNAPGERLDAETSGFLSRLGAPVHTLLASPVDGLRDAGIEAALHDDFAFVHNRVGVDVQVRGLGLSGHSAEVELWRDGELLRSQTVVFSSENDEQVVAFEFVPDRLGKSVFSVRIPPVTGDEATLVNNENHFIIKVIRDKIRVLQVCGRPSTDERFLRRMLKENPNVDLISFFILRTTTDVNPVAQRDMSLIPFPKDELFDQELPTFDLVIFQNFNFGPYMYRHYLDRLSEFVRGGGGFLMIGGDLSFSHGGYERTPVADILPVELRSILGGDELLSLDLFRPALTAAGRRHPITRLAFDPAENGRIWETLPQLEGSNVVAGLAPGATALAVHPTLDDSKGDPMPMIAIREVGEGRTMTYTTDSSWFWAFDYTGEGGSSRPYNNFWSNAIRWLIHDIELKLIRVELEEEHLAPGATLHARVRVLTPDYAPASGVEGLLRVYRRDFDQLGSDDMGDAVVEIPFITDASGQFLFEHVVGAAGVYVIEASSARVVEGEEGEAPTAASELRDEDILLVTEDSPEFHQVLPRADLMSQIATRSGGRARVAGEDGGLQGLSFTPPRVVKVARRRLISLWDTWWIFAVIGLFLSIEWLLRRRWGRI